MPIYFTYFDTGSWKLYLSSWILVRPPQGTLEFYCNPFQLHITFLEVAKLLVKCKEDSTQGPTLKTEIYATPFKLTTEQNSGGTNKTTSGTQTQDRPCILTDHQKPRATKGNWPVKTTYQCQIKTSFLLPPRECQIKTWTNRVLLVELDPHPRFLSFCTNQSTNGIER